MTSCCVLIPFFNRHEQVAALLESLLAQVQPEICILLVDDGSALSANQAQPLAALLQHSGVSLISHDHNLGVAAARNSGLHWCRQHDIELVIMIDSDCLVPGDFIATHLRLHAEHPEATCIGGQIIGSGSSAWAHLDGAASWVHATPHQPTATEFRPIPPLYHLATTNFSVKISQLPLRDFVFDERLNSGEDCLLVRELRAAGQGVYFSSVPAVLHRDRERLLDVFQHHYEWGHHQYFIQLGNNLSPRCFNPAWRIIFFLLFLPLLPLFALAGSCLNVWPLCRQGSWRVCWYPFIYLLWLGKGVAVLESAINPWGCLRHTRHKIDYRQVTVCSRIANDG